MGSKFNCFGGSQRLVILAEQLHLYKPPPSVHNTDNNNPIEDPRIQDSTRMLVSQELGSAESATFRLNRAAVLICIFEGEKGDLRVILTKRSSTLSTHSGMMRQRGLKKFGMVIQVLLSSPNNQLGLLVSGEVSLPGGKTDEGDANDIETATREAKEEIGLDPSLVSVVTVLEPFVTKRGMTVVPVIGILSDKKAFNPTPNAAEVEAIFDAPLEMFLQDENRKEEEREWMGDKYLLHFFDYETENKKYVIWALTAGILIGAASVVYQRPPAFAERRPKFWTPIP